MIGEIRDVVREWMVERLKITDEQVFYPYLEVVSEGEGIWDVSD